MTTPEHSKPIRLAAAAYHAGRANKWDTAERAVKRLSDECGPEGVNDAMVAWCDTFIDHAKGGAEDPRPVAVSFWNGSTGAVDTPGSPQVPAEVQWAARLITARAEMDQDKWVAVLAELPEDGVAVGRHVWTLLQVVVWTISRTPNGYARMGQVTRNG